MHYSIMEHHKLFIKMHPLQLIVTIVIALWPMVAQAETFHIRAGATNGDGTANRPWANIKAAIESKKLRGGDEVRVHSGNYGTVHLADLRPKGGVRFVAHGDGVAHFDRIIIQNSRNLALEGLSVWPGTFEAQDGPLIHIQRSAQDITLDGLDIRGRQDAEDYMSWSRSIWVRVNSSGILAEGNNTRIQNTTITGIGGGIGVIGEGAWITNNVIRGFSHDGVQAIGDNLMFQGNRIQDCFAINSNHDDGFQSWSTGPNGPGSGTVRGMTIDANSILQWTGDPKHPLACSLQGIGMFDGMYQDLKITNNIISVSAYHGIGISGAINAEISHNTVINALGPRRDSPWIEVNNHRNGKASQNVVMINNLAPIVRMNPAFGHIASNAKLIYPASELIAPYDGDFRPKPDSNLIDAGEPSRSKKDILGNERPKGARPDIGAYEVK